MNQGWNGTRAQWVRWTAILLVLAFWAAGAVAEERLQWTFEPRTAPGPLLDPPLPPTSDFPTQLVLDDDSAEGDVGINAATARQFLWFNSFSTGSGVTLEEIWVLFQPGDNMSVGGAIDLVVYEDSDGDPTNGATLLAVIPETIQVLDGATFSTYTVDPPVESSAGGLLIGVIPRFITSGVTTATNPAAIDTDSSLGNSWVALWTGDPPASPELPSDDQIRPVEDFVAGNWMIRGFGQGVPEEIPTLDSWSLGVLIVALAAMGWFFLLRRRGAGLALLLLPLALMAPESSAVVVDNFETDQTEVFFPDGDMMPRSDSVAEAMVGDILGGTRDLRTFVTVADAGPATAVQSEVTGGQLELQVNDDTPDNAGGILITWDGDSDPMTLAADSIDADLTAGGHTAFRLRVAAADAGTQIVVRVYTDADNASEGALVLPAVAAPQDFFLGFGTQFTPFIGAGADFSGVGAIEMEVRGVEVSASIDLFDTVAPTLEVTLQDLDPMTDLPLAAPVAPGDRIKYRVEITNPGGGEALQLDFADTVDSNTTLDAATVDVFPVAVPDTFKMPGNIDFNSPPGGVLRNDADPDSGTPPMAGDSVTCAHIAAEMEKCKVVVASSDTMTALGGTVTWLDTDPSPVDGLSDGAFQYVPPAGRAGVDTFSYTFQDDEGNTATAQVNMVIGPRVWFVDDDDAGSANLGTLAEPFNSIASFNTNLNVVGLGDLDTTGDILFFLNGTDNIYNLTQPIRLENEQQLMGEGTGLVLFGITWVPAGTPPQLRNATGNAVELGFGNTLRGFDVGNTMGYGIVGDNFGTATIEAVTITGNGGALELADGTLDATFPSIASTGSAERGIDLDLVGGDLMVTGTTTITDPEGTGIRILDGGSTFDFGGTTITGAGNTAGNGVDLQDNTMTTTVVFDSLSITTDNGIGLRASNGGTVNINSTAASVNATGGAAVDITNTSGQTNGAGGWTFATLASTTSAAEGVRLNNLPSTFTVGTSTTVNDAGTTGIRVLNCGGCDVDFGTTSVMDTNTAAAPTNNGIDLATSNAGATFTFDSMAVVSDEGFGLLGNGGTIEVGGAASTINAVGDRAVDLNGVTFDDGLGGGGATFASVSSSASATVGAVFQNVSGFFTANGGTITGATGTAFAVGGAGNGSGGSGNITYAGAITNTANRSVEIVERSGGTVTVSGNINDTGTGVRIANNDNSVASAIVLSGTSKVLNTGANTAVTLDNNDDATVSFTNGGLDIDTSGTVIAFNGINGATGIVVSGSGNSIDTTNSSGTGRAVNIVNTTIGGGGVLFESVTVNGVDTAINLANVGAGPFEVGGDGANAPNMTNGNLGASFGSGGSITNTTADAVVVNGAGSVTLRNLLIGESTTAVGDAPNSDINIDGDGVDLTNVTQATFDNVKIADTDGDGIKGTGVAGLTVLNSELLNNGITADNDETGIDFRGDGSNHISGTVMVVNTIIDGSQSQAAHFGGTGAATIFFTGGQISNQRFGAVAPNNKADGGIELNPNGGQTMNLVVRDTICLNMEGPGCYILLAEGGSTINLFATGTRSENLGTNSGFNNTEAFNIETDAASGGTVNFHIFDNDVINSRGSAARLAATASGVVTGIFNDNDIDGNAISTRGVEVQVDNDSMVGIAQGMVVVDNNTIDGYGDHGIEAQVRDGANVADFAFTNNVVGNTTTVTNEGFNIRSTDTAAVNMLLKGNNLANSTDRGMDLDVEDSAVANMMVVGNTINSPSDHSFNPETEDPGSVIRLNLGVEIVNNAGTPTPTVNGNEVNDNYRLDEDAGTFTFGADDVSDPDIGGNLAAAQVTENGNTTGGGAPTLELPNGAITVVNPHANWGITATGGDGQSATVSTAFASNLQVTVLDASGSPVSGVTVTFTNLGVAVGPSGTPGSATAVTNASGVASVSYTANALPGKHFVMAKATGVPGFALFTLTNNP